MLDWTPPVAFSSRHFIANLDLPLHMHSAYVGAMPKLILAVSWIYVLDYCHIQGNTG